MANQTLDQDAVNLAKAIRQSESGGNFSAKGASGENGAYQFTADTWNESAPKYGINVPIEKATPEQQNAVAYNRIKAWKDAGYDVTQISSMWNAGAGEPNAYTGKFGSTTKTHKAGDPSIGTNSFGVKYDVPSYVKSVATAYQTIKGGGQVGIDPNNPSGTPIQANQAPKQQGYTPSFQIKPEEGYLPTIGKTLGNIPKSALNFGEGFLNMINPLNIAKNIGQIGQGLGEISKQPGGIGGAIPGLLAGLPEAAYKTLTPESIQKMIGGDVQGGLKQITEDPVGQIAPVVLAGEGIAKGTGLGGQFDKGVKTITEPITKPVEFVGSKISQGVKGIRDYAIGQESGVNASTVAQTIKNPEYFTKENIKNADSARTALGSEIKDGLNQRISQLSETGQGYDVVKQGEPIQVDPNFLLDRIQKETGLDFNGKTFEATGSSFSRNAIDIGKIQKFYDTWQPMLDRGVLTPEEFLNMRQDLSGLSKFEGGIGKSKPVENVAKGIRANLNAEYRPQIKGLENIDADFSSQIKELSDLRKGILDKNGELTSSAISKIANATGKGKIATLSKLEEISPGITKRIGIVKALEDWQSAGQGVKVGTYGRAGTMLAGFAGGGLFGGILATVLTSPEIIVPLLRAYGKTNNIASSMISGIINKINTATPLSKPEIEVLVGAISTANENQTDITGGQSISQTPPTSAFMPITITNQNKQKAEQEVSQETQPQVNQKNLTITLQNGKIYKFPNLTALQDFIQEAGL